MAEYIDRRAAIEKLQSNITYMQTFGVDRAVTLIDEVPSADVVEVVRCKDCKHNPKDAWFGCPMSHMTETQKPDTAWCWKGERKDGNV